MQPKIIYDSLKNIILLIVINSSEAILKNFFILSILSVVNRKKKYFYSYKKKSIMIPKLSKLIKNIIWNNGKLYLKKVLKKDSINNHFKYLSSYLCGEWDTDKLSSKSTSIINLVPSESIKKRKHSILTC